MQIFQNVNYDFLGKRKLFYFISGSLLLIGILNIVFRGLKFGVDFKGGSEIVLEFQKPLELGTIRNNLQNIGIGNIEVKTYGADNRILIRSELQTVPRTVYPRILAEIEDEINKVKPGLSKRLVDSSISSVTYEFNSPDTANLILTRLFNDGYQTTKISEEPTNRQIEINIGVSTWIKENLKVSMGDNPFKVIKEDKVGPKVGNELKEQAVIAIFLALVVQLVYLAFRFKFVFSLGAVIAMFHDVLITLGLYSILYGVIPGLNLEIDLTIVAAFLTLIGYSINDTVVVFDRVRENMKIHKTLPLTEVINRSVNQTLSRTILTGGTTLMALFVLIFFGGEVLRAFSFTLFFGIITGTYSSVFVASAMVLDYTNRS
ncbi:MAG TPA: protein translocase subunit SecF, partial [Ignavibacteriaceae bacterium]|nr:protein translocase subunit SecF [Ignavibacteriaceae bacterium]